MKKLEKIRDSLEIAICSAFIASIFFYGSHFFYSDIRFYGNDPIWFFIIQAISGILAVIIPYHLRRENKIEISPLLYCFYLLFLFASLFLGELCHFYLLIPSWDSFLHFSSGFLIFLVSYEWLENIGMKNTPNNQVYFFLFSCLSALALGSIWEIYEFISDGVFGTNMQRFLDLNGFALIGRNAIMDTMTDLVFDALGAGTGILYYIYEKKKNP